MKSARRSLASTRSHRIYRHHLAAISSAIARADAQTVLRHATDLAAQTILRHATDLALSTVLT